MFKLQIEAAVGRRRTHWPEAREAIPLGFVQDRQFGELIGSKALFEWLEAPGMGGSG